MKRLGKYGYYLISPCSTDKCQQILFVKKLNTVVFMSGGKKSGNLAFH